MWLHLRVLQPALPGVALCAAQHRQLAPQRQDGLLRAPDAAPS
jgi:hypothetical protein